MALDKEGDMKQSIQWHKECLKNRMFALQLLRDEIAAREAAYKAREQDADEYREQIALAEKRGLTAFDSERLGKKRGK